MLGFCAIFKGKIGGKSTNLSTPFRRGIIGPMSPETHYSNQQLAEIFQTIANLLEIKGEVIYKILAYRKAADSLNALSREAYELWQEGKLTEIPGVGKAIADMSVAQPSCG